MEIKEAKSRYEHAQCIYLRTQVFINGQNVSMAEEITKDEDEAISFLGKENDVPLATARFRIIDKNTAKIERVAVAQEHQGKGFGKMIMDYIIEDIKKRKEINKMKLSSQSHAIDFYKKLGFNVIGDEYMDAGIPHQMMEMKI